MPGLPCRLDRLTQPRPVKGRNLKGLNFFSRIEQSLLAAGFNIVGLRRADLWPLLTQCSPATLSRQLARLRQLGVIKRVTGTYRYSCLSASASSVSHRSTPYASISAKSWPSIPGAPLLGGTGHKHAPECRRG